MRRAAAEDMNEERRREIADRRQVERALRDSEHPARGHWDELERLYDAAPIGLAYFDRELRYVRINECLAQINGSSVSEHIGRTPRELTPQIGPAVEQRLRSVIETGQPVLAEDVRGTVPSDPERERDWMVTYHPVKSADGNVQGVTAVVVEITERKRTESALRLSEGRYRTLVDTLPHGIEDIDPSGVILFANAAHHRQYEYSEGELIGRNVVDLVATEEERESLREYLAFLVTEQPEPTTYFGKKKTATGRIIDVQVDWNYRRDQEGHVIGFTSVITDISERLRVERMKDEFISTVSHELRTPLTSIRGALGLIATGAAGALSGDLKDMVEIAHKNSTRLGRLVDDILDIGKIESAGMVFRIEPLDVESVLRAAIKANLAYAEDFGVEIVCEGPTSREHVMADADRLMQVLSNLISNAIKFAPRASVVRLEASSHEANVRIAVTDAGPGVPEAFHSHVFERFTQADASDGRSRTGTGLGLSICKAIVEKLGGQIGFETAQGKGTTFYFDLPMQGSEPRTNGNLL